MPNDLVQDAVGVEHGLLMSSVLQQGMMSCDGSMHNCVVMRHITLVYAVGGCTDTNLYVACDLYRGR